MQTYLKTRPVWIQLLLFMGMAFGIFFVISMMGVLILSKLTGISVLAIRDVDTWDPSDPNIIFYIRGLLLIQFVALFVVPTLLFGYFSDPRPADYLGLKAPVKAVYWILGMAALILAIPFVDLMGVLNQKLAFGQAQNYFKTMEEQATKQIQFMLSRHTPGELVLNLIFIALFAGVGEELFFRGVLQPLFIRATQNPWMGIIITAAVFSAFHFQFFGFIPRFLLGILLGAIYWYSGSLLAAMLAHFAYDGFMIVLVYFNPKMIENVDATLLQESTTLLVVYGLISLGLVLLLLKAMKRLSPMNLREFNKRQEEGLELPKDGYGF